MGDMLGNTNVQMIVDLGTTPIGFGCMVLWPVEEEMERDTRQAYANSKPHTILGKCYHRLRNDDWEVGYLIQGTRAGGITGVCPACGERNVTHQVNGIYTCIDSDHLPIIHTTEVAEDIDHIVDTVPDAIPTSYYINEGEPAGVPITPEFTDRDYETFIKVASSIVKDPECLRLASDLKFLPEELIFVQDAMRRLMPLPTLMNVTGKDEEMCNAV